MTKQELTKMAGEAGRGVCMINLETWEKETYETPESIKLIGMRYLLVRYSKGNLVLPSFHLRGRRRDGR